MRPHVTKFRSPGKPGRASTRIDKLIENMGIAGIRKNLDTKNQNRLQDSERRTVGYLRLSVTDRCNLRCQYCAPAKGFHHISHGQILSYEELTRLTKLFLGLGIGKVRLTGGEPLVRLGLVDFARQLKALPVPDLRLTTNGVLLEEMAEELFAAGISRVNISLDTLQAERFREITRGGDLDRVRAGLRAAERVGFDPIKLNVVVMRGVNDDELEAFGRLALDKPYHVRFIEFMPLERNSWKPGAVVDREEILARLTRVLDLEEIPRQAEDGPAQRFRIRGGQGEIGLISPISNHFCPTCNRLRITSDGKLLTCLFASNEVDLREPLRSGASDDDLLAIINEAVAHKPKGHKLAQGQGTEHSRTMGSIGG